MTLKYTTVQGFWKFLLLNESITDFQPGQTPERETVASNTVAAGDYYLNNMGVNEDTLVLYKGGTSTALTPTTHYTFDSDTSKVTITSAGATLLDTSDLTAEYEYNSNGKYLNYNQTTSLLAESEADVEDRCNTVFADQTSSTPGYLQVNNEPLMGQGCSNNLYSLSRGSIVKLQTTVDGDYTTGASTIDITDATGFPESGTIYIGGNKVTYTSKASNTLTIPSSTQSISDGAVVRGEVVEVTTSPTGVTPTFTVLTPDTDYIIDYNRGDIQLVDSYYSQEDTYLSTAQDGILDRVRVTYMQAWHKENKDAEIPSEIAKIVYMIAGRQLIQRTVLKSHAGQRDNFNPTSFGFSKIDIDELIKQYKVYKFSNV